MIADHMDWDVRASLFQCLLFPWFVWICESKNQIVFVSGVYAVLLLFLHVCTPFSLHLKYKDRHVQLYTVFVLQICNMTDADIAKKLIRADWPEPLRVLLLNTLRVNPQERWTAKQAAYYICTEWIMSKCTHDEGQDLWNLREKRFFSIAYFYQRSWAELYNRTEADEMDRKAGRGEITAFAGGDLQGRFQDSWSVGGPFCLIQFTGLNKLNFVDLNLLMLRARE